MSLKNVSHWGNSGQNSQYKGKRGGEKPPIAHFQLPGQSPAYPLIDILQQSIPHDYLL